MTVRIDKAIESFVSIALLYLFGAMLALPQAIAAENEFESSQTCKQCHEDIYRNWRKSLHALSFTNPIFLTAYRKAYTETRGEAKKYCLNCHAPTVMVTGDYDMSLPVTREGVTCDFCHTVVRVDLDNRANPFVSSPGKVKRSVLKDAESEHHETAYSEDFSSSKLCAGCHNFVNRHGVQVGSTYNEWKKSPYAKREKQCQHCHMEEIAGKTANEGGRDKIHDHSLSHNLASMKEAVILKIKNIRRSTSRFGVEIEINNIRVGHSIPTGTPERQLILEVSTLDSVGRILETQKKIYRKTIVDSAGVEIHSDGEVFLNGMKIINDNRIKSTEKRIENFIFSKRVKGIKSVTADVYFLYQPSIAQMTEMRIPLFSVDSLAK